MAIQDLNMETRSFKESRAHTRPTRPTRPLWRGEVEFDG